MEVDFIAVDESSKAFKERALQSTGSCSIDESIITTDQLRTEAMAATTASPPGPITIFQKPINTSPMQLFGSAELSFASSQSQKVRINKQRYSRQQSPPPRVAAATQGDDGNKRHSAQVAPFNSRSFGGSTDSLPHMDGMIICPH